MIEYQSWAFLEPKSPPRKQLETPSCLCFAFFAFAPAFDNLPFIETFLLGIALETTVLDYEPHPDNDDCDEDVDVDGDYLDDGDDAYADGGDLSPQ